MLKQRVITAAIMLAVFASLVFFASSDVFALFITVAVGIAAWEWSRLCGVSNDKMEITYAVAVGLILLVLLYLPGSANVIRWIMLFGVLVWGANIVGLSFAPVLPAVQPIEVHRLLLGVVLLPIAGLAIFFLRHQAAESSPWLLLYSLALIWAMDTGAYFSGKRFGKNKLAPLISPGKTWEGVYGGLAVTMVIIVLVMLLSPLSEGGVARLIFASLFAAAVSVVGDLFESRMKRASGYKDSSQLLPGHGGVLDRIDGVLVAIPVFVFFWVWM